MLCKECGHGGGTSKLVEVERLDGVVVKVLVAECNGCKAYPAADRKRLLEAAVKFDRGVEQLGSSSGS